MSVDMNTSRTTIPRPGTGILRLRANLRGRGFVVGVVDAVGAETTGFAPRDRVTWRDTGDLSNKLILRDQGDVLGVPRWISDEQVVSYLGPALVAHSLIRAYPVGRGDRVQIESAVPLVVETTAAWARALGVRVCPDAEIVLRDDLRLRRAALLGRGKLAEATVEVFQNIRRGVFDAVTPHDSEAARVAA